MNWVYFTFLSLLIQEFELMITCFNEDQELSKASTFQECSCESERVRSYSLESLIAVSGQAKYLLIYPEFTWERKTELTMLSRSLNQAQKMT
jgi:hypothetical protein